MESKKVLSILFYFCRPTSGDKDRPFKKKKENEER